ncbi:hypothetical protein M427DRAFT_72021 [Gonapodya prolifera JEL478]|uniref:RRN7-type domain-containing protein n=1 Tax=Gonapodya prolifera (strain JEL478) TaxID=1344416 RepID=A0A139A7L8_GONPJ|nr:hypothetical protein M427DRAFT_72021 [Gonapodya prolifera JEL478]|eukprot:KXS12363.1 hypothetical protein M427DRAFT_72021 [Gonapodya prolifera JEL478]
MSLPSSQSRNRPQSQSQSSRRRECPVCRSTVFRWDPSTASYVCQLGHRLEGFRQEEGEETLPSGALRLRRPTGQRKRKKVMRHTYKNLMASRQMEFHRLEALQIVLKAQVQILVHKMNLPAQLDTIVRDLWLLYVNVNPTAIEISENEAKGLQVDTEELESDSESSPSEVSEEENLDERLRNDPLFQESDEETDDERARNDHPRGRDSERDQQPELAEDVEKARLRSHHLTNRLHMSVTVSLCYLGCVWLRVPVLMKDFHRWMSSGRLPYISAADVALPQGLRDLLWGTANKFLRPPAIPSVDELFLRASAVALRLKEAHRISFPPLNFPIVVFRFIEALLLPPEFYPPLRSLLQVFRFEGSFKVNATVDRKNHPEVVLIAIFVVLMKMVYGLDGYSREMDSNPLSKRMPPFATWVRAMSEAKLDGIDAGGVPSGIENLETFIARNPDKYMSFVSETVIGAETNPAYEAFMKSLNPKPPRSSTAASVHCDQDTKEFTVQPTSTLPLYHDINIKTLTGSRPGFPYRIENSCTPLNELNPSYLFVLDRCAEVVGVEPLLLHKTVRRLEQELVVEQGWMTKLANTAASAASKVS